MNIFQRAVRKTKYLLGLDQVSKGEAEMRYWRRKKAEQGTLPNEHYAHFYTTHFGLSMDFYKDKEILDIGCGPCGSLEWADMASERVGLDPLVSEYLQIGANQHKMQYVIANSEHIPFPNRYFDVVCSFNSLDHVDALENTILEIERVLKIGGLFLLITDLNHKPTVCEPISYSFDIIKMFPANFELLEERHFEKKANGMYESITENIPYNHEDKTERYGVLSAKFRKK